MSEACSIVVSVPDSNRRAFHAGTEGPNPDGVALGFKWLEMVLVAEKAAEGWIVVNAFDVLSGVIAEVIGASAARQLGKGETLRLGNASVRCYSERTLPSFRGASVVLALYPTSKVLDKLDSLSGVQAIAVVPWNRSEVAAWIRTWSATDLTGQANPASGDLLSPLFRAAMLDLTESVNLSTGIGHPSDHDTAVHIMRTLRGAGEHLDAAALKTWLQRNSWSAKAANEVVDLAGRIFEGRSVRVHGRDFDAARMLQRWREASASDEE